MRYRANTRLKGAPRHLAPAGITDDRLLNAAKVLACYSTIPQREWDAVTPIQQRHWLAEAEHMLHLRDRQLAGQDKYAKYAAYRDAMQALPPVDDDPYW